MDALVMCGGRGTRLDAPGEKPLFEIAARPMVDRVLDALAATSRVDGVYAVVTPHTPATRRHLEDARPAVTVLETPGEGYVADLQAALATVGRPVVTAVADLPLLAPEHVTRALEIALAPRAATETASRIATETAPRIDPRAAEESEAAVADREVDAAGSEAVVADREVDAAGSEASVRSVTVCVPVSLAERLGASVDTAVDGLAPTGLNVVAAEDELMYTTYDARLAVNVNRLEDAALATDLLGADR